ncbi:MAG TPA: squalene synthase HpnC [Pirellulales bacterium]|jgi:squalene synthase HpnC|nr:squalene synthase HpnC [Pirellulales bacterium]
MPASSFTAELAQFGPTSPRRPPTPEAARDYCRRLAQTHYENFKVGSWFLPARLRAHFYPIYAYCRWADDLADEVGDPARSESLLNWWEHELDACYAGTATHPVFVALRETIEEFDIPAEPFRDLLTAFRQDQRQTRYATADELLGYCRHSADPVGRLVLYLGRCHTPRRVALSNSICSGLQWINFCQDVRRDYERGRIYLPHETWRVAGYDEAQFAKQAANEAFRRLLKIEVDRAAELLQGGRDLPGLMPRGLRWQMALFLQGGLAIVRKIRDLDYDVWSQRPVLTKRDKLGIAWQSWRNLPAAAEERR